MPKTSTITITKEELAAALAGWEDDARNNDWPPRTDPDRHTDAAESLINRIERARG